MARIYKILRTMADYAALNGDEVPPAMQLAVYEIPGGARGTEETLKRMVDIVRKSVRDPKRGAFLRGLAMKIIVDAGCKPKDYKCEAKVLHEWVRDKIRWTRDVRGMETLQFPWRTLEFGAGDCDDKSILLATLAIMAGMPARYRAIGADPDRKKTFTHVYVMLNPNGDGRTWLAADPTVSTAPLSWESPVRYVTMDLDVEV